MSREKNKKFVENIKIQVDFFGKVCNYINAGGKTFYLICNLDKAYR